MRDYYQILNVPYAANGDDIKKAYKELAVKYHPDWNKEPDASLKFINVHEAYEILGNDKKRLAYNMMFIRHLNLDNSEFAEWEKEANTNAEQYAQMPYTTYIEDVYNTFNSLEEMERTAFRWVVVFAGLAVLLTCTIVLGLSIYKVATENKPIEFSLLFSWLLLFAFGFLGYKTIRKEFHRYMN
jgi:hypothetical protein